MTVECIKVSVRRDPDPGAAAPWLDPLASLPSACLVWFYFGVVGSFVFLLIQLLLFIDFAHSWNQRWVNKAEKSDSRAWYAGQCHPMAS